MLNRNRSGIRKPGLAGLPTSGPGVHLRTLPGGKTILSGETRGTIARASVGSLVLTKKVPVGYDPGESPPPGIPIFVTWGTAGAVIPDPAVFTTPIDYVTASGTRYVWAKVGLSESVPFLANSLEFVTHTSPAGYVTPPFGEDGSAPALCYVPLGQIVATGAEDSLAVTLNNGGRGSISVAIAIGGIQLEPGTNRIANMIRNLSYWRVDAR